MEGVKTPMKNNQELRDRLRVRNIPYWQLGEAAGISENTVVRWLRTPLTDERKKVLLSALDRLTGKE